MAMAKPSSRSGLWVVQGAALALLLAILAFIDAAEAQALSTTAGSTDIRSRVGSSGRVQLSYLVGGITFYAYTDGAGVGGTADKTHPGTWWTVGFDTNPNSPNAVTLFSSFGQHFLSNNRDLQVLDVATLYSKRIWWTFYEVGDTRTYKIGNTLGKQVLYEFFSFSLIYTKDGATAFSIVPYPDPVPPVGTENIRDKVGTGPVQISFVSGGVTNYIFAAEAALSYTPAKEHPGTWWRVRSFGEGPSADAVVLFQQGTNANLSNTGDIQIVDVLHSYPARVWWYFYPTNDGKGTYKIGNALGKQVFKEFVSFTASFTKDGATAFSISGASWDTPPPPGTVDVRERVGSGPIQLTFVSAGVTWYTYANSAGVGYTADANYPGTWWQPGFDSAGPHEVTLFNSYSDGFLSNTRDVQIVDVANVYGIRKWWYFYEVSTASGGRGYKIGNVWGKQLLQPFLSFSGVYTLDGATTFSIVTASWSSTLPGPPATRLRGAAAAEM